MHLTTMTKIFCWCRTKSSFWNLHFLYKNHFLLFIQLNNSFLSLSVISTHQNICTLLTFVIWIQPHKNFSWSLHLRRKYADWKNWQKSDKSQFFNVIWNFFWQSMKIDLAFVKQCCLFLINKRQIGEKISIKGREFADRRWQMFKLECIFCAFK